MLGLRLLNLYLCLRLVNEGVLRLLLLRLKESEAFGLWHIHEVRHWFWHRHLALWRYIFLTLNRCRKLLLLVNFLCRFHFYRILCAFGWLSISTVFLNLFFVFSFLDLTPIIVISDLNLVSKLLHLFLFFEF